MEVFWETISNMGLQDLGFSGNKFAWSNGRAGEAKILVRLDRALATSSWRVLFANSRVLHLPRINSDHSPILILCDQNGSQIGGRSKRKCLFHFEKKWMEDKMCASVVESGWDQNNPLTSFADRNKNCGVRLSMWDKVTFGNVGRSIKITRDRIDAM
ncbi:hypothetical protein ACS0TY_032861 [Phlomoides rotata]